jgi:outer membrane protein OmpA-like peptidoglycan-associated protein
MTIKKNNLTRMKTIIILFWFLGLNTFLVLSQSAKLKKANDQYQKLSYKSAIDNYTDLLSSDIATAEMKAKLAHSYFNTNDLLNAEKYYEMATASGVLPNEHYFYFSQTLKQLGKYSESDKWMNLFYEKTKSDKRANSFNDNRTYLENIDKAGIHFSIKNELFNSNVSDFGGYESYNHNKLYFLSSRRNTFIKNQWMWDGGKFLDLFMLAKGQDNSTKLLRNVTTNFHEGPLCFNKDESIVYFTRNNVSKGKNRKDKNGIQNLKLFVANINEKGKWFNVKELSINSKEFSIGHPTLSPDGNTLYFVSDMPGGFGGADLYRVSINTDGSLGNPVNLGVNVNTEGQEMFPWISPDGLLFFSSNGHVGLGGLDVFVMSIEGNGTVFRNLTNVGKPLNGQYDDFAITFNRNGKTGYFSSNRAGGKGNDDIYSFEMTRPFIFKIQLIGTVKDEVTKLILAGSTVLLKDLDGNVVASTKADLNGNYSFDLEPGKEYVVVAQNNDYTENKISVFANSKSGNQIKSDIELSKVPQISLIGLIKDNKSGNQLDGVLIKIIDKNTGTIIFEGSTDAKGDFLKELTNNKVNDQLNYSITLSKNGYLTKTVDFTHKIVKPGIINVNDKLDVSIGKIEIGVDLATLIDIKPIYFDLGKYVIRKNAADELDKIVKIMNEYPTMQIELGSHTDCRSSIAFNKTLSDNRAVASADYIKKRISNPQRINGKGYGESKLKVNCPCEGTVKSNCSEDEHQKNRRTEFIILKM